MVFLQLIPVFLSDKHHHYVITILSICKGYQAGFMVISQYKCHEFIIVIQIIIILFCAVEQLCIHEEIAIIHHPEISAICQIFSLTMRLKYSKAELHYKDNKYVSLNHGGTNTCIHTIYIYIVN